MSVFFIFIEDGIQQKYPNYMTFIGPWIVNIFLQ